MANVLPAAHRPAARRHPERRPAGRVADGCPAITLASQSGPVKGNVPLPFHLSYDPAQVKPGHRYAVSARIELDGKLLFINTEHHGVQLDGNDPQPVRIKVDAVR